MASASSRHVAVPGAPPGACLQSRAAHPGSTKGRPKRAGVRDALDAMFEHGRSGSLSSGLHHAKRNHEYGLCYINGLALAALRAISKHGVKKVAVLDTDSHCGGGTFQLVGENERICADCDQGNTTV